jgi:predicted TIM-barrel fold metal-dependent hydrolase
MMSLPRNVPFDAIPHHCAKLRAFQAGAIFVAWDEKGGWDDEPKTPRFRMPPDAADCHVHIVGPAARFPFVGPRAHRAYDAPKEVLREIHRRLGIARCVVVHGVHHGDDMSATLDALFTGHGAYRAIMPNDPEIGDRRLSELNASGFRGVRFNFMARLGGPPAREEFLRASERIAPLGWHILIHMDAEEIHRYEDMLRASKAPLVFDHMLRIDPSRGTAQEPFQKLVAFLKEGRDWAKISALEKFSKEKYPFRDICGIAAALVDAAPDRCIWGSDWPHPDVALPPTNDADLADLIPSYAPTTAQQQKLLVDNPARLYGF